MARTGIKNTEMLLMKPFSIGGLPRCMSRLAKPSHRKTTKKDLEGEAAEWRLPESRGGSWMPDSRTGIYFPAGQEWVMDDIPKNAASFDCTFWLRSTDGVVHHKP